MISAFTAQTTGVPFAWLVAIRQSGAGESYLVSPKQLAAAEKRVGSGTALVPPFNFGRDNAQHEGSPAPVTRW